MAPRTGRHWKAFRILKEEHPETFEQFVDNMYEGGDGWGSYQVCKRLEKYTGIYLFHARIDEIKRRYPRNEFPA